MKQQLEILTLLAVLIAVPASPGSAQDFEATRAEMVQRQILRRGVTDEAVLVSMRSVPRHLFVPENRRKAAYGDHPLPIGYGQTISQPYIVAYMTEIVRPRKHHRVLEIGTGSGYQAAVLAEIVDSVYTIEIVPELGRSAKARLDSLGYDNVEVRTGDGYYGWEEHAPFDAIVVTAAAPHIPPPLVDQLKDGGHMIIPVGTPFLVQSLVLVKKRDGEATTRSMMPVRFVPFTRSEK